MIHSWLNLWMWNSLIWKANCVFIEKKMYKWTCAVQTQVVQGSNIYIVFWYQSCIVFIYIYKHPRFGCYLLEGLSI